MTTARHIKAMRKLGVFGALAALVAACSPAPMPISRSSTDPSSPNAPEGVTPAVTATPLAAPAPREGHEGHHHHHHHHGQGAPAHEAQAGTQDGGAQVVYVCPMHPEVTSNGPGICPKCNMKLVPKK